ncbi:hypothetical protein MAR_032458 [Mya arenaria]|uniref:Uncharacterized protein n=1 Tax=Mya arenaria TaxID=6604 RepID=A0ABY7F931_MYAAR|nr:hypothetical protein MAR_032458 [Mya arenaria]
MDPRVLFFAGLLLTGSVPSCNARSSDDDDSWFSLTNLVIGGVAGIGAVVAAPVVLGAAGFGAAGVAAGSLAAAVQSAGAAGLGVGAKAALFMGGAAAGSAAIKKNDEE